MLANNASASVDISLPGIVNGSFNGLLSFRAFNKVQLSEVYHPSGAGISKNTLHTVLPESTPVMFTSHLLPFHTASPVGLVDPSLVTHSTVVS